MGCLVTSGAGYARGLWGYLALFLVSLLLASCAAPATPAPIPTGPLIPSPFPALLEAGDAHSAEGARTAAEAAYWEAGALRPSDPTPYLRLADLYLDWNRPQEGLAAVNVAERLDGPVAQAESLRASLHALLGDWEQTIAHGTMALALESADGATRHLVARGYLALGRVAEAQALYRALLEADPADGLAHERLGALLTLSDPADALPHLQAAGTPLASDLIAALEETAGGAAAYRLARVGQTWLTYGEPALAVLSLEQAVIDSPAYADAHALLGQTLDQLDRPQEALDHLEAALALTPDSALCRSLLGLHYLQVGDHAAARPHLEGAYDLDPDNPVFSLHLASVYAGLGQYTVAEVWLREATRLAPEDALVWEAVTRFYLERGLVEGHRGLEAARALAQLEPQNGPVQDLLGWAYFLNGHSTEAEEHLLEAIELDPSLASAHYHLGQLYAYLGRVEEARAVLTRALDLNTDPALRGQIEQLFFALP